jgi:hypothetical protein
VLLHTPMSSRSRAACSCCRSSNEPAGSRLTARHAAEALDAVLAEWSGSVHEDFWHLDSVPDSPEWARLRDLAFQALIKF